MPDLISVTLILTILKITGGLTALCTFMFGVFKVINWIKTKLANIDANVVDLKNSMDENIGGLREEIKFQTATLATALSEQRSDFRSYYAPYREAPPVFAPVFAPARARAKRAPKKATK